MVDQHLLPPTPEEPEEGNEMAFLDHLEELRWRLLKALGAIGLGAVVCLYFSAPLLDFMQEPYREAVYSLENERSTDLVESLQRLVRRWIDPDTVVAPPPTRDQTELPPARRLQAIKVMTTFFVKLQIAFLGGLLLALPVVFYQFWQFVAPGLLKNEKRVLIPVIALSVLCFTLGAAIAYYMVLPLGLRFFLGLEAANVASQWAIDEYIGFVMRLILGFGIVFELPVLSLSLSRLGLLTPEYLRHIRRYAIVVIFVIAAVFTPPDPFSQMLMALPILFLYELSIWISAVAQPKKKKA